MLTRYTLPICNPGGSPSNEHFAVNKIICIGRNYAEHAREMGHDPEREPPFFFFKPQSALAQNNTDFIYPHFSQQVEHEIELVIAIGKSGAQIGVADAADYVFGFGVGLDMTCRDRQKEAKKLGRPWELGKGFDGSAPCTAIQRGSLDDFKQYGDLVLTRNGEEVQRGNWRTMVWSIPELIAEVSRYIKLEKGDLIFTGTPAGVGEVQPGDKLCAKLEGFAQELNMTITKKQG
ncbi:fumarylacetoacetate hydrolase family protein [Cellvibrio fibrivorans]|uniref:Fumarylpyruvate hydrolase n=1 Tax=Cellvibrio fibrivorans TaxID=126350 RepID=A0ABU1V1Y8_9GAMM|nr:fumarylacetoacetate hydrolase family protein [Cellvibrio fibrivorans]MDR7091467.1 fumarylpyruvate hydrolase [Cellvibrio fibrivorans]